MRNKVFNADTIVSVRTTQVSDCNYITFHPGRKKNFWHSEMKPGYYGILGEVKYTIEGWANFMDMKVFFKDRKAYFSASVTVCFVSGEKVTKYFQTDAEAVKYAAPILDSIKNPIGFIDDIKTKFH